MILYSKTGNDLMTRICVFCDNGENKNKRNFDNYCVKKKEEKN